MMAPANLGSAVATCVDPDAMALIDLSGPAVRVFSYRDIEQRSDAFARGLQRRGLRRGERMAILAANSTEFLIAFLGTMRAGLVSVPVNYKLPAETVNFVIDDADARLVLCDVARRRVLRDAVPLVVIEDAFDTLLDAGPFTAVPAEPGEPAMFLYTSGSTGRRRAWCCRIRAISGCCRCAPTRCHHLASVRWWRRRYIT